MREVLEQAAKLFNDKLYFECHDLLEEAWSDSRGDEKRFLHALIQVSVGMYHVAARNHQGAVNLLSRGVDALASFEPVHADLDVRALRERARVCRDKSALALGGNSAEWSADDVPFMRFVPAN